MVQRVWTDIRSDCNRLAQQIEAGCGSGLNGRIDFVTTGIDNNSEVEKAVGEWMWMQFIFELNGIFFKTLVKCDKYSAVLWGSYWKVMEVQLNKPAAFNIDI